MNEDLESTASALVAEGNGILAADEIVPTLSRRFEALGIRSDAESRRTYTDDIEANSIGAGSPPHRRDWRDD